MSYILDALRRVERERAAGAPGISTVHSTTETPRFRIAPLMYFAVSLAAVVALVWVLRPAPRVPVPVATVRATPERVEPPRVAQPRPTPRSHPSGETAVAPKIVPPGDAATLPRTRQEARTPATPSSPAARSVEPATPSAPATRRVEPATPPARNAEVPAPAPPPAPRVASTPAPASPLLQGMKLEVLVYSDNPPDRIVFINGRKYVEGQTVDGGALVERIDPDGVTLIFEGRRAVLRQ